MIKKANLGHVSRIKEITDNNSKQLGFITRGSVIESIKNKELIIKEYENKIVGLCKYHKRQDNWTTIYDIVVQEKYRRMGFGYEMINYLLNKKHCIKLKCPVDLKANKFYKQIGKYIKTISGKKRDLNLYIILPDNVKLK